MKFEEARQQKFDAGRKEHNQPWDLEHIDHLKEIQDEFSIRKISESSV